MSYVLSHPLVGYVVSAVLLGWVSLLTWAAWRFRKHMTRANRWLAEDEQHIQVLQTELESATHTLRAATEFIRTLRAAANGRPVVPPPVPSTNPITMGRHTRLG